MALIHFKSECVLRVLRVSVVCSSSTKRHHGDTEDTEDRPGFFKLVPVALLNQIIPEDKLILASRSPRRAEILTAVGWPFESVVAGIDEKRYAGEDAVTYVRRLAHSKASAVAQKITERLVLGADTVVEVDGEILGQPANEHEARRMLRLLSGKWHQVLTGVALVREGECALSRVDHEMTRVRFAELSDEEIDWYVASKEPMDKAGAYAVQGKAGVFITEIQGDYFNIVGLPIRLVYEMLRRTAPA